MTADVVQIQLSPIAYDMARTKKAQASLKRSVRSIMRRRWKFLCETGSKLTTGHIHVQLESIISLATDYEIPLPDDVAFWLRLHRAYIRQQAVAEYSDLPLFATQEQIQNGDPHD